MKELFTKPDGTPKRGLIMGVTNKRSLAWGITKLLHEQGAELALSYFPNEAVEKRIRPLAEDAGINNLIPCDVGDDDSIAAMANTLKEQWGNIDFVLHAIAFADHDALHKPFVETSREQFLSSLDISAYSLVATTQALAPLMVNGGSILTLTYLGATQVVPNYNVMGVAKAALEASVRYLAADLGTQNIRVNALSAGPVKTLAASGIGDFSSMLNYHKQTVPLKRLTSQDDVAGAGAYLLSDLSQGVSGTVHFVDGGAHVLGPTPVAAE